jgi:hypothetical protein
MNHITNSRLKSIGQEFSEEIKTWIQQLGDENTAFFSLYGDDSV